jgi:hypothetical protein
MKKVISLNNPVVRKVVKGLMKKTGLMGSLGFHNIYDFTCGQYVDPCGLVIKDHHEYEGIMNFIPIWHERIHNLVVNEALDDVLDVYFESGTQSANWYIAIFGSDDIPAGAWTYAVPVCTEFTNYDEATREAWVTAGVSSQSLDNSASPAEFTCTSGTNTIYGAMLNNTSTKGDVAAGSGILYSAARFGASRPFNAAEVLKIVITINSQDV